MTHRFIDNSYDSESLTHTSGEVFTKNWPVVYLLENGTEMYIGQTYNSEARFKQHFKNPDRKILSRSHIIIDEEYNQSATLDIESWLIQYMAADGQFRLQNSNKGLADHEYYDRERYRSKFEVIWKDLQVKKLAINELVQLRNTDLFKYSPYKALTEEQLSIAKTIRDAVLIGHNTCFIINGGAGTGKSVLASFLVKYLKHAELEGIKIGLIVPMTSLRNTFRKVFASIKGLSAAMVLGPGEVVGKEFDVLIVDEAHRLRQRKNLTAFGPFDAANRYYGLNKAGNQLDWIIKASKTQILLYDEDQNVMPGDVPPASFRALPALQYQLTSQLRVLGGNDYIDYIDGILNMIQPAKRSFDKYDLQYFDNIHEMQNAIKQKDEEFGLARIVAGYAWNWSTKKDASVDYDIELDGLKLKWNSTNNDWVNSPNALNEVGCIHTVQGYDLNYVGVIIGPEVSYDVSTKTIRIDKTKYLDYNGRRSIDSDEELTRYILNIYKTLLTRGIRGVYVHAVDPGLERYLKQFMPIHKEI